MADLLKVGLEMRERHFRELLAPKFPSKSGPISRTRLPTCPQKRAPLWCIFFALSTMNGQLPADLKFKENTDPVDKNLSGDNAINHLNNLRQVDIILHPENTFCESFWAKRNIIFLITPVLRI